MPNTEVVNPTKNSLSDSTRTEMIELLQATVADSIDLQLAAKQAHWNAKGKSFIALHELFDDAFAQATEWVDMQAERLVQLGGVVEGTLKSAASRTRQPEYPVHALSGEDHVEAFSTALASFGKTGRDAIEKASKAGDEVTVDMYTEVTRAADKMLYFVESHAH